MQGRQGNLWLHRFAVLTACATFLLIVAGALVVGHEAGLSVPDWPLSFGTLMPPMEGNVFYEHGHRMIAGLVGTLMTVLAIWLWRTEPRKWVRWLGLAAVLAVILQAILGGMTVLYLLPIPILIGHACLAQLFFCMTVSLAVFTSPAWNSLPETPKQEDSGFPAFRNLSAAATLAIFIQLILGAARRHKWLGLAPHLIWAGVVTVLLLWVVYRALNQLPSTERTLRHLALAISGLLIVQLGLGFGSYSTRLAAEGAPQPQSPVILVTTAHVAVGALLLGTSLILTLLAYRKLAAAGKILSFNGSPQKTMA